MQIGGFNPSAKYESQLGLLFPFYMESHQKMFQSPISMGFYGLNMDNKKPRIFVGCPEKHPTSATPDRALARAQPSLASRSLTESHGVGEPNKRGHGKAIYGLTTC